MKDRLIERNSATAAGPDSNFGNRPGLVEKIAKDTVHTTGGQMGQQNLRDGLDGIFGAPSRTQ